MNEAETRAEHIDPALVAAPMSPKSKNSDRFSVTCPGQRPVDRYRLMRNHLDRTMKRENIEKLNDASLRHEKAA